ncbi:S1C family serine protease [Sinomonas sp. R1AF57]|uniref:S1C family serine protease n=1 Tax=Sinomonas sp. R1AF57 TaxID=2020377 RepID=UPI002100D2A1|nr:trypsin-like peptidase domain-containing protein [Sinomonas sp. R1AF57]
MNETYGRPDRPAGAGNDAGQDGRPTPAGATEPLTSPQQDGMDRPAREAQNGAPAGSGASGAEHGQVPPAPPQAPRFGQYASTQQHPQVQPPTQQQGQTPQGGQPGPGNAPHWGQSAPHGQGYPGQHPQQGQPYGGPSPFGPTAPQGSAFYRNDTQRQRQGRWGTGVLVGGMLVAGLVGGGVAAGTSSLWAPRAGTVASSTGAAPVIVNNQDSVNAVTAAAAKAAPSVVTIGVTSGNSSGTGSGVVIDDQGHILTNTHVVTLDGQVANPSIEVRASDGSVYKGTVVGTDPLSDLAVVKIEGANLPAVSFGDSSKLNVGDIAVAIGAPLGLDSTVTDGIVSTLNRTISVASSAAPQGGDSSQGDNGQGFQFAPPNGQSQRQSAQSTVSINVIQTDAAINPGNSGGALVNSKGELVGINVAIASTGQGSTSSSSGNIGVGFSIPANYAHRIAQEIIANGKATHGQLGVSVQPKAANGSNSSFSVGAQVAEVTSGSAADKAGIKVGDVITGFAGRHIGDASELTAAVREQAGGSTAKVSLQRNGQNMDVDVTLGTAK